MWSRPHRNTWVTKIDQALRGAKPPIVLAAHSLGWGAELGSLEVGKRADVVVHDCHDHRELAYFAGLEPAAVVVAGGKIIYEILDA